MKKKIILDTDIGNDIDDAVTLTYLLCHPDCELLGVTTMTGEVVKRAMVADSIIKHFGRDIPVYPGVESPILGPQRQPNCHQARATTPCRTSAHQRLARGRRGTAWRGAGSGIAAWWHVDADDAGQGRAGVRGVPYAAPQSSAVPAMSLAPELRQRIEALLQSNRIVLFMKGEPQAPQCGFSAKAVAALSALEVPYAHVNVLADGEIREGIKTYGSWPTIPQLYIEGEPGNEDDPFYAPECLVHCTVDANGTKHGTFDFVLKQVTERENVTPESLAARV
jgi:Grx4 family monothiol glutaredoxin